MASKQSVQEPRRNNDAHDSSLRCCCGSLLARLVPQGVELKCRRCKRHVILPLDSKIAAIRTTGDLGLFGERKIKDLER
jgi:hypothetical protein